MTGIPFIDDICLMTDNMYRLGWDERNGGNISCIIDETEAKKYFDTERITRSFPVAFDASYLAGKLFAVTGTGRYFKNVSRNPENDLGVIKVSADGHSAGLVWGFEDGGRPTSELASHFMSHIERLKTDPKHKVVMHAHPVNLVAMTFIHTLDEREFTRTLWRMCTECVIVFPDGIGVLPWMLCGNDDIGRATAAKIRESRLVVWAQHGIFGTGDSLDEAFGLLETAEKAAEIFLKINGRPILQQITDEQLALVAKTFGVSPKKGYLEI